MKTLKIIFLGIFLFSVTACKATGGPESDFDREDQEPSLNVAKRVGNLFTAKARKENQELRARLERLENAEKEANVPVNQPANSDALKSQTRKENDELRARLERLENAQNQGNVPASQPAPIRRPASANSGVSISQNGATDFQEWKRARSSSSNDYEEFKEYKEWLEFKKLKKQNN